MMTNARILKAHSHSHSMSGRSFSVSVTHHSMSPHSHSHSIMWHSHSNYSKTPLTLKWSSDFEWSMSEKYTSLELHSTLLNHTNMADRWLNRLACLNNIVPNNRNRRKPYLFDYGKYDEEQFWNRYRLTKAAFRELLEIIRPDISAHNDRGKPIPADIQLLLTLRFYATGTFQLACETCVKFRSHQQVGL